MRGRRIAVPKGRIRPTQDRVREALFASLAGRVSGARFLDLFAGSGAVGLEAWSRGADYVCWVEAERRAFAVLKSNVGALCGDEAESRCGETRVVCGDAIRFLLACAAAPVQPFDIVFADPPYDRAGDRDWTGRCLTALEGGQALAEDGVFVIEQSAEEPDPIRPGWEQIKDKRYGGTRVRFFVRTRS